VKKQILTKQDIQRDLLTELNKRKALVIWLSAFLFVAMICYVMYIVAYINGSDFQNDRLSFSTPCVAIPIGAFTIPFLVAFLVCYYYLAFYKIKSGKIEYIEEKLYKKAIEDISYYHRTEKENALYFRQGRFRVNKTVYSYSNIGDSFYIVFVKSKKKLACVYHTKYYDIAEKS